MIYRSKSSRAFILADAMAGLAIVSIVATLLTVAVVSEHRAEQRLADVRAANRLADRVLLNLQHHQPAPVLPDATINLQPATDDAPVGFKWVTVETVVNGRRASLIGIIPSAEGAQ